MFAAGPHGPETGQVRKGGMAYRNAVAAFGEWLQKSMPGIKYSPDGGPKPRS